VRFGLRFLPLLYGEMKLGRIVLEDARVVLASLPPRPDGEQLAVFDENGLVSPDAALSATFAGARALVDTLGERTIDRVQLRNLQVQLAEAAAGPALLVTEARLRRRSPDLVVLEADVELAGRRSVVAGELATD